MPLMIFESEHLKCRRWVPDDFDALLSVYSDREAMRWVGDGEPISRKECEEWFKVTASNYAKRGYGMFALVGRDSAQVIGFAGLVHPGGQSEPEIKYALLRAHWGHGLATEAVKQLIYYGLSVHHLTHIIATVAPGNVASQRVLEKAGMVLASERPHEDGSKTLVFEWRARSLA